MASDGLGMRRDCGAHATQWFASFGWGGGSFGPIVSMDWKLLFTLLYFRDLGNGLVTPRHRPKHTSPPWSSVPRRTPEAAASAAPDPSLRHRLSSAPHGGADGRRPRHPSEPRECPGLGTTLADPSPTFRRPSQSVRSPFVPSRLGAAPLECSRWGPQSQCVSFLPLLICSTKSCQSRLGI